MSTLPPASASSMADATADSSTGTGRAASRSFARPMPDFGAIAHVFGLLAVQRAATRHRDVKKAPHGRFVGGDAVGSVELLQRPQEFTRILETDDAAVGDFPAMAVEKDDARRTE